MARVAAMLPAPVAKDLCAALDSAVAAASSTDAPMIVLARQEVRRFNRLVLMLSRSILDAQQALQGLQVMSSAAEDVAVCLRQNRVPAAWTRASFPSCRNLATWVADLAHRAEHYTAWSKHLTRTRVPGEPESVFVHWLSGLFFPQGFLTAALQTHARTHNLPIDALRIHTAVLALTGDANAHHNADSGNAAAEGSSASAPMLTHLSADEAAACAEARVTASVAEGVLVRGLWLQGASWDAHNGVLAEPQAGQLYAALPLVHLSAVPADTPASEQGYQCPVYKTSDRAGVLSTTGHSTNFVASIELPCPRDRAQQHWVRRGAAAILEHADK
jgi:dynein heavy chain